jgi:hypothetical protein
MQETLEQDCTILTYAVLQAGDCKGWVCKQPRPCRLLQLQGHNRLSLVYPYGMNNSRRSSILGCYIISSSNSSSSSNTAENALPQYVKTIVHLKAVFRLDV